VQRSHTLYIERQRSLTNFIKRVPYLARVDRQIENLKMNKSTDGINEMDVIILSPPVGQCEEAHRKSWPGATGPFRLFDFMVIKAKNPFSHSHVDGKINN